MSRNEKENMSEDAPLVSMVIPHFQTKELARLCLRCIRAFTGDPDRYETIVVDNNSRDGSLDYLRSVAWIRLIERPGVTDGGAGGGPHGEAMDIGMKAARGEYLLGLHTDLIVLAEGWLDSLLGKIEEDPQIAAVGGDKLESISTLRRVLKGMTDVHALKEWLRGRFTHDRIKERRPYIRTHCALYRMSVLRGLDLSFQRRGQLTSGEHLCMRLNEGGYRTVLLDSRELMPFMTHLSHGTRVYNPNERTRRSTLRKGRRRLERLLELPVVRRILADDSLDG